MFYRMAILVIVIVIIAYLLYKYYFSKKIVQCSQNKYNIIDQYGTIGISSDQIIANETTEDFFKQNDKKSTDIQDKYSTHFIDKLLQNNNHEPYEYSDAESLDIMIQKDNCVEESEIDILSESDEEQVNVEQVEEQVEEQVNVEEDNLSGNDDDDVVIKEPVEEEEDIGENLKEIDEDSNEVKNISIVLSPKHTYNTLKKRTIKDLTALLEENNIQVTDKKKKDDLINLILTELN